jgi:hypothetical protein
MRLFLGSGKDRFALTGLDGCDTRAAGASTAITSREPAGTARMSKQAQLEVPKILLEHHPDSCAEVLPFHIAWLVT